MANGSVMVPVGVDSADATFEQELQSRESSQELVDREASKGNTKQYYFGFWCWHPQWMQVAFANAKFFTFLLCINGLVEGALVNGFSPIVVTSVERRFRLPSTLVAVLLVTFDISVLVSVIFISYFGDKRHKPRWMGYGLIVQGIGAFVVALPQFLFGKYKAEGSLMLESCIDKDINSTCDPTNNWAYIIMLFGNVLIGVGAAPLLTLGLSYIDDITLPKYVPIHMGIFYLAVAIGPAIGYGLGGAFLSIYVDPMEQTDLTESDPGWVGAWWLCFIFSSILSLMVAVPFFLYPRLLSNHAEVVAAREKEHPTSYTSKFEDGESSLESQLKALPLHLWELCKSKSFVFVTMGLSSLFLTLYGLVAFGPKFVESVFNIPASTASILAGAVAIPAGGLGTIVGSLVTYYLKSDTKRVAVIPWVTSLFILPALLGFFITCSSLPIAGINTDYPDNSYSLADDVTMASCNSDCNCNSTIFEPVCGADQLTYFSPCRAGCQKTKLNGSDGVILDDCVCVSENLFNMSSSADVSTPSELLPNSSATAGRCPQTCNTLGLWLLLIGIVVFLVFLLRIPTLLITIRSVAVEQRSLALGLQSVLWRALGSIPGPIIFGVIFDASCVYWQYDCGRRGNCWVYNNHLISLRGFFFITTGVLVNFVLMLLCWIFYPPVTCSRAIKPSENPDKGGENHSVVNNPVFDPEA